MKTRGSTALALSVVLGVSGCETSNTGANVDPTSQSTTTLCRALTTNSDQAYRQRVASLLVRRGATAEKCQRLIAADNSMAAGIAIAGVAVAAGAAAKNGGGYYVPPRSYGVAWDQFYNEYYQLIWRCRDRSTGRFVYDSYCYGEPMVDYTWPGWSA